MNAILGYAQVLQRSSELVPSHRSAVETIHNSGDHLLNVLDEVLELSKIESGRLELHERDFDLTALLENVRSMIEPRCEQQGVQFRLAWEQTDPRWVRGDEAKLSQILINLLGNAVKFTEEGEIGLEVSTEENIGSRGDGYRFAVTDTGPGISQEDQDRLFLAFEQGTAGLDRGGTGLGLAIARHYSILLGGELGVTRSLEKDLRLHLPLSCRLDTKARHAKATLRWRGFDISLKAILYRPWWSMTILRAVPFWCTCWKTSEPRW